MTHDRTIQAVAGAVLIGAVVLAGGVLTGLTATAERHVLRYTNLAVAGAPPVVALGTAIGALRGIIVDYLWIKVHIMKQKGLYYEVMADADLITKLQPRFSAVWAFHGHNMAYNISVVHNTEPERWEWVKQGIDLIRNRGLRYNPNDLQLHRELAFFFAHKIEGVSDDAHLFYKREFAREWHNVLGRPPYDYEARIQWIKVVADAAATLDQAERATPGVTALVEKLRTELEPFKDRYRFALDKSFLKAFAEWEAIKGQSAYARIFDFETRTRQENPVFVVFDEIAGDPEYAEAWKALVAHVRKRVLLDDYNMDPQLMYEYTRDFGPIDWRHGQAHALYWSLKGSEQGEERVELSVDEVYRIVNNDRIKLQAMQGLARWGRINLDLFSNDWVSRLPDPRWIDVIDRYWEQYSIKHRATRGPGPDIFMGFHQNFLSSSVRELYRSGEVKLARKYRDRLCDLYGMGNPQRPNPKFCAPLEIFVWNQVKDEYTFQSHLAASDVAASLRYAFRIGIGQDRPEVFQKALEFSQKVTRYFKENEYNAFVTKMGSARLGALIDNLENSAVTVFAQLMVDTTVDMGERLVIYRRAPDDLKVRIYDLVAPLLRMQLEAHPLGSRFPFEAAFPEPPGLEAYRRLQREKGGKPKDDDDAEVERR
ncbi:MAG: hypothetical protein IID28_10560 [Planctomycetes bacterium]|nr:hypothetical protein [Planctomycetota bacterium]